MCRDLARRTGNTCRLNLRELRMKLAATKYHGMGNDFIVIDCSQQNLSSAEMSQLAIRVCDRKGLLGADGAVFISNAKSERPTVDCFYPNGSISEFCVNGFQCAARALMNLSGLKICTFDTDVGVVSVEQVILDKSSVNRSRITLPVCSTEPSAKYYSGTDALWGTIINDISPHHAIYGVSLHVPQLLIFTPYVSTDELVRIGKALNSQSSLFPLGVNASFVATFKKAVYVRTFVRGGVGLTESCASAMFASCLLLERLGRLATGTPIRVLSRGGVAYCVHSRLGTTMGTIESSVSKVFSCDIEYNLQSGELGELVNGEFNLSEVSSYSVLHETLRAEIVEEQLEN
jgi:diaminopimelate epimerase